MKRHYCVSENGVKGCSKWFRSSRAMKAHRYREWVKELGHKPGVVKIACIRMR